MKPSSSLLLLVSMVYLFLFAVILDFGISAYFWVNINFSDKEEIQSLLSFLQAFCSNYEETATDGKSCPKIQKPVCGTDGQTYNSRCEFCKAAMERNGNLGLKHDGKC
ncbi:serine protease inhibitor Kazal-type 12-like [Rhynchonycteris naso]